MQVDLPFHLSNYRIPEYVANALHEKDHSEDFSEPVRTAFRFL